MGCGASSAKVDARTVYARMHANTCVHVYANQVVDGFGKDVDIVPSGRNSKSGGAKRGKKQKPPTLPVVACVNLSDADGFFEAELKEPAHKPRAIEPIADAPPDDTRDTRERSPRAAVRSQSAGAVQSL